MLRAALQPLGTAGAGGKIQLPPAAGAVVKPNAPLVLAAPKIVVPSASGTQSSSGRPAIQIGPNSPAYFPEFEDSPIYRFFRDRFTAPPDELAALKSQISDDIARHVIDGFIGPGPFAQEPTKLGPTGKITDEMFEENDIIGHGFGCHKCGIRDLGIDSGHFILDHRLPIGLNFGDWMFMFYPHCETCMWRQGGHVRVIRYRLKRRSFIP